MDLMKELEKLTAPLPKASTDMPAINQEMLNARMMRGSEFLSQPTPASAATVSPSVSEAPRAKSPIIACPEADTEPDGTGMAYTNRQLPGIFVDFTGCEDLLEEFNAAALTAGMKPGESALDLIYLFANGELHLKVTR